MEEDRRNRTPVATVANVAATTTTTPLDQKKNAPQTTRRTRVHKTGLIACVRACVCLSVHLNALLVIFTTFAQFLGPVHTHTRDSLKSPDYYYSPWRKAHVCVCVCEREREISAADTKTTHTRPRWCFSPRTNRVVHRARKRILFTLPTPSDHEEDGTVKEECAVRKVCAKRKGENCSLYPNQTKPRGTTTTFPWMGSGSGR